MSARFEREARVLASLNHSNIAAIYGLEESGERKFLVMELVAGETLAERIKRGPIPVDEDIPDALRIALGGVAQKRGLIPRVPDGDRLLADIAVWVTGEYPDAVPFPPISGRCPVARRHWPSISTPPSSRCC